MSKRFTWNDMTLCKDCHYKDKDPCLCHANGKTQVKPDKMIVSDDCSKYLRESKWERMSKLKD